MSKTAAEIEADFYTLIKGSSLEEAVTGTVYYDEIRPRDSEKEDIVIMGSSGEDGQTQIGVVTIHIYVPDIMSNNDGLMYPNRGRIKKLERAAQDWFESIKGALLGYSFRLYHTIHITADEENINQHYVVIQIKYKLYNY